VTGPLLWRARFAWSQFHDFATRGGLLPYLLVFTFLSIDLARGWWRNRRLNVEPLSFDLLLASGWIAYWFFIGGDYLGERFLLILFPLGIFGLLELVKGSSNTKGVALLLILVALFGILPLHWFDSRFHFVRDRYDSLLVTGSFLRERYPGKSVLTGGLGKVPFLADSYTVDAMGLIDPVIAHAPPAARDFDPGHVKFNIDYGLSRGAALIVERFAPGNSPYSYAGPESQKYKAAGYRLEYLIYAGQEEPITPILDTGDMPEETIKQRIDEGYEMAILVRAGGASAQKPPLP
jgi:hypothetical protein